MTLKELEPQLSTLTPVERAQLLELLTQMFSKEVKGISKIDDVCGGDACISGTRIPIWVLVSLRQQGSHDADLLGFYPGLSAADLVNAWAYAETHTEEIEGAIFENEAA